MAQVEHSVFQGGAGPGEGAGGSRQLSLFSSGDWGHPAYQLPPEVNLLAVAHYIEALELQREFIRIQAVLGGKNPHPQTYLVGGMATAMDGNEPDATINPERITLLNALVANAQTFVRQVYLPDVLAIAGFYPEWFHLWSGSWELHGVRRLSGGSIKDPAASLSARHRSGTRSRKVHPFDPKNVTEYVTRSWYEYPEGDQVAKHPSQGETNPKYSGPKPPYEFLKTDEKYSWLKSPRYNNKPMEVGPLARTLVAYASGDQQVKHSWTVRSAKLKLPAYRSLFHTGPRRRASA